MFDDIWRIFKHSAASACERERLRWRRDPLSHPSLERMSLNELADLPFGPAWPEPPARRRETCSTN